MRDIVSSLTTTALIQASNIAGGVLLARFLLPDGRGELAAVMLWPSVIAFLGIVGLHEAIAYHTAQRRHGAQDILRHSLLFAAGMSLILVPIGALAVHLVFADKSSAVRAAAFLYLAFIPLNFAGLFLAAVFQGRLRFAEWNLLRILVNVVYTLLIPVMYLAGMGSVFGFALASLIANAVMVAAAAFFHWRADWRAADSAIVAAPDRRPAWRDLLTYGISVHVGSAVAFLAERLDQIIISLFLASADLGLFVVATTLARLPLVLVSTLATVAFPKIVSMEESAGKEEIFGRYARVAVLTILPASLALAVLVPFLLPLFFGAAFAGATTVAWVLIAAAVPLSLKAMMSAGFKACNEGWMVGQAEVVTLALSAVALALLVPAYGLMGAAAASVVAQGGALAFMLWRAKHALGIPPASLLVPRASDVALIADIAGDLGRAVLRRSGAAR
jgi:O-antigen/teichoic acid export membrane protein